MKAYYMNGVQSAQIQAVGVSLQLGHRIWGIAPNSFFTNRMGPARCWRVIVLAPDYQCGSRTLLEVQLGRRGLRWRSRGEIAPGHYMADEVGLRWFVRAAA